MKFFCNLQSVAVNFQTKYTFMDPKCFIMVGNGGWSTGAQIQKPVLPWHVRVIWPVSTAMSGPALLLQKHYTGLVTISYMYDR